MSKSREADSLGPIPQRIADDKDTDPNLFEGPSSQEATAPRCYMCGRSAWAYDDGFEAGIAYALTQVQGMLQLGVRGEALEPAAAQRLTDWFRYHLVPRRSRPTVPGG